jgi:hypothetical protein
VGNQQESGSSLGVQELFDEKNLLTQTKYGLMLDSSMHFLKHNRILVQKTKI